jgi:cell division protease FtsH
MYAEETAQTIDAEVRRLVMAAEASARAILEARRDVMATLSDRLLEREVVEGDELRALLTPSAPATPADAQPLAESRRA